MLRRESVDSAQALVSEVDLDWPGSTSWMQGNVNAEEDIGRGIFHAESLDCLKSAMASCLYPYSTACRFRIPSCKGSNPECFDRDAR